MYENPLYSKAKVNKPNQFVPVSVYDIQEFLGNNTAL